MTNTNGQFDLQLFADLVAGDGTILMTDSTRFALKDGQIVFLEDEEDSEGNEPDEQTEQADESESDATQEEEGTEESDEGEESASEQTQSDEDEEPTFEVKADGKTVTLTLTQLLELAPKGLNYTRKTQELAEERKALESQRVMGQPPAQQPPAESKSGTDVFLDAVDKAKQIAKAKLGLQPTEDLVELDLTHQAAFQLALKAIVDSENHESVRIGRINNLEKELREQEPLFDDIYQYATSRMEELPQREYRALEKAWNEGDTERIRKFFDDQRKNFYAEKKGSSTTPVKKAAPPPKVEKAGTTPLVKSPPKTRDASILSSLDAEGKAQMLKEWGLV